MKIKKWIKGGEEGIAIYVTLDDFRQIGVTINREVRGNKRPQQTEVTQQHRRIAINLMLCLLCLMTI